MSRELDAQVAKAMGTTKTHDLNPADVPYMQGGMVDPFYSTDWSLLPSMLAWLQARAYEVNMNWSDSGARRWYAHIRWNEGESHGDGDALLFAVCKLVLAVAAKL